MSAFAGRFRAPRARWLPWLLACAAYPCVTVAITWPLTPRLNSSLPHDGFDPALTAWIVWWNAHATPLTARWWSPPIFSPMPGALALSEHLVGISLLTTPLQWLGASAVTSHNAAFLLAFALTAIAAHALVFAISGRHDAGIVAGCAAAFCGYRMAQLAHVQVLWTFGVPVALTALHRYVATRRRAWLAMFAGAVVVQALSNGYLLLHLPVLVLLFVAWFCRDRRDAAAIAAAAVLAAVALAPFAWGYYRWQAALSVERSYREIDAFGADVTSLVAVGPAARLWAPLSRFDHGENEFFPGALVTLLIAAGVVAASRNQAAAPSTVRTRIVRGVCLAGAALAAAAIAAWWIAGPWAWPGHAASPLLSVRTPQKPATVLLILGLAGLLSSRRVRAAWRRRSVFGFYLVAALATFLFALGPNPRFDGTPIMFHGPYYWLLQAPGFSGLRVPARFGVLFAFSAAVAAALAFARITASLTGRVRTLLAVAAGIVIVGEAWPRMTIAALPPALTIPAGAETARVLELPLATVPGDAAAMLRAIAHRRPLVNGYSGYTPIHYTILSRALELGDAGVLDPLCGDRDLLVAIGEVDRERWSAIVLRHPRASLEASDDRWRLYRIARSVAARHEPAGPRLPVAGATASSAPATIDRALDGDLATFWRSDQPQRGGEAVTVDLRDDAFVATLRLDLGPLPMDFPRQLRIDCAGADGAWETCWAGSAAAVALAGALEDPRTTAMTLPIRRGGVRRLRLRQVGSDPQNAWSIAELSVYGSGR